jgi:hypothetical protein
MSEKVSEPFHKSAGQMKSKDRDALQSIAVLIVFLRHFKA